MNAYADTGPTNSFFAVSQGVSLGGAATDRVKTGRGAVQVESTSVLGVMS